MVRALASPHSGPGSILGLGVICGLSLLLVLVPAPRVFLRVHRFPSLHKNQHSIWKQWTNRQVGISVAHPQSIYYLFYLLFYSFNCCRLDEVKLVRKKRNLLFHKIIFWFVFSFNLARLRDIRQVPGEPRRPLSSIQPSNTDSSTTTDFDTSGTPISSHGKYSVYSHNTLTIPSNIDK